MPNMWKYSSNVAEFRMIILYVGDNLPTQMCQQYIKKVNTCYYFKLQCEWSDTTLRHYLSRRKAQDPIVQVVLKEEPSLHGDNSDLVTFSNQILSLENSKYKQPICNEADDTSPFSNSNEASYKQGHCNDTEQIFVAADGEVPQKTKEDKLLEPNAEKNIKECIVPSPL